MPKYPRNRGLIRQWKLLRALEAAPGGLTWNQIASLADEPTDTRTIRRDVHALKAVGFPVAVINRGDGGHARITLTRAIFQELQ